MAVAVGNWLDMNELRGVVSYPATRNTLQVANYDSFDTVVPTLRESVCGSEYMLSFYYCCCCYCYFYY